MALHLLIFAGPVSNPSFHREYFIKPKGHLTGLHPGIALIFSAAVLLKTD